MNPSRTQWLWMAVLLPGCVIAPRAGPSAGTAAPALEGADASGRVVRLSDYRGKVVLIDFWRTG
jgi:hypothetical protein